MSYSLATVLSVCEKLWPVAGAEPWDAPGLIVGAHDDTIDHVLLAVDAVHLTSAEAIDSGADLLLVHHPLLLRGVTTVASDTPKGRVIADLIRAGCALAAAHTNADIVGDGTSGAIARSLGLTDLEPITPSPGGTAGQGIGRVGVLPAPIKLGQLAQKLARIVPATATGIRVAGDYEAPVRRIAVCGGAGDSLLASAPVQSADVYITSDLRHHPASEAREHAILTGSPALIDISHWASEWLWLDIAARQLAEHLPNLTITVSELRTDPWDFVVTQ